MATIFQVKSESLPTRCDICHQADCYDAAANLCARCQKFALLVHKAAPIIFQTGNNSLLRNFGWQDGSSRLASYINKIFSAAFAATMLAAFISYIYQPEIVDTVTNPPGGMDRGGEDFPIWVCGSPGLNMEDTMMIFMGMLVIYSLIVAIMYWHDDRVLRISNQE